MANILARQRQLTGTTAQWATDDLIIGNGELALEVTTTGEVKIKVGDGAKSFSALSYVVPSAGGGGTGAYLPITGGTATGSITAPSIVVSTNTGLYLPGLAAGVTTDQMLYMTASGLVWTAPLPQSPAQLDGSYLKTDGTNNMTADMVMGGNKITGVKDATANSDVPSFLQVKNLLGGITGARFRGAVSFRATYGNNKFTPPISTTDPLQDNDWIVNTLDGYMSVDWIAQLSAQSELMFEHGEYTDVTKKYPVYAGDSMFYGGGSWHYVAASALDNKFISKMYDDEKMGSINWLLRTSAANVRPIVTTGGFKQHVSTGAITAAGVTTAAGCAMILEGQQTNSFLEVSTKDTGASVHNYIFAPHGSLRIPQTAASGVTVQGDQVHLNANNEDTASTLNLHHKNGASSLSQSFTLKVHNRGVGAQTMRLSYTGYIIAPSDLTFTYGSATQRYYMTTKLWQETTFAKKSDFDALAARVTAGGL